jgi:structural maintenance of chromosome 3 (chondroitin sulfate proteoglycan 6)
MQWYVYILFPFPQDGDHDDDDQDEVGPREANPEGRVEKYIGVKVKASVFNFGFFIFL